jgi:hypothetical protein
VIALIVLIYRRGGANRPIYQLPRQWTYGPILWAATGEVIPTGHDNRSHGRHGHAEAFSVGGGASGHW